MTVATPNPADFTAGKNKACIAECLTELHQALVRHVAARMQAVHGREWRRKARESLNYKRTNNFVDDTFDRDLINLLRLMRYERVSFMPLWKQGGKTLLDRLIGFRNQWAHEWDIDATDTLHVLDLICKLMTRIGADATLVIASREPLRRFVIRQAAGPFDPTPGEEADPEAPLPPPSPQLFGAASHSSRRAPLLVVTLVSLAAIASVALWWGQGRVPTTPPDPRPPIVSTPSSRTAPPVSQVRATPTSSSPKAEFAASRYLSTTPGNEPWVLFTDEHQQVDVNVTDQVARALRGQGSAFLPAFIADGRFEEAFEGDPRLLRQLRAESVPLVVLGKKRTVVSSEPLVDKDYVKATTTLTIRVYQPTRGFASQRFEIEAIGPGFSSDAARKAADQVAVSKLIERLGASDRSQ